VLDGVAADELMTDVMNHLDTCESCVASVESLSRADLDDPLKSFLPKRERPEASETPDSARQIRLDEIEEAERLFVDRLKSSFRFMKPESIGPYQVLKKIGQGSMGEVFECQDERIACRVAVKTIRNHVVVPILVTRISQEARMLAGLNHPNIVRLLNFGMTADGMPYLAMELVEGGTLSEKLRGGKLKPRQAALLIRQCADALEHAHEMGVLHRDLKPSNVLLDTTRANDAQIDPDDAPGIPKIVDFGLAKYFDSSTHVTQSGSVIGTPSYMAPEQIQSGNRLTRETDIYALGTILYESITGESPFRAESLAGMLRHIQESSPAPPRSIDQTIPLDLETICLKCLEKRPEDRYVSAACLSEDLQRFLDGRPVLARRLPLSAQWWRWGQRNRRLAASFAFSVLLLAVMAFGGVLFGLNQSDLRHKAQVATLDAKLARAISEKSAVEAFVEKEKAEAERKTAEEVRDVAVRVLDRATTVIYHNFLATRASDIHEIPAVRRIRGNLAFEYFRVVDEMKHLKGLEADKPDYLVGLLYKAGVIHWEMQNRKAAFESFTEMLRVVERMPANLRELDGVVSQTISAQKVLGERTFDLDGPQAGVGVWLKNWNRWYARGPDWFRKSPYSVDTLYDQGRAVAGVLERLERWDDLRKLEPELAVVERIRQENRQKPYAPQ
jgi:serine/threonine protein kinase